MLNDWLSVPRVTPERKISSPAFNLAALGTMARAISTAAAAFTSPAPWLSRLSVLLWNRETGNALAVRSSVALASTGVSDLFASSINASTPETTGAEKDVPEYLK